MSDADRKSYNVTIKDVALAAGVSYSTVSRVINESANVHPDKRKRVIEAMTRLGYVVNQQARSLAGGKSQAVGLLVPDLGNGYTGTVVRGIDDELSRQQYHLMLYTTHRTRESIYVQTLMRGLADGLLLLLPMNPEAYLESLKNQNFPYVVIDHQGFDDFSPTVVSTNYEGAYEATNYLISLGHRRIGFVAGDVHTSSAFERLEGYQNALKDHGIEPDDELVVPGKFLRQPGYQAGVQLLNLSHRPTAIFAANDDSAFGVIDAVRERQLRIPEDISIIGFDDVPSAAWMTPALTTVRQSLLDMGRVAVRMLLNQIENPGQPPERIRLPTKLVLRETCQRIHTNGSKP